MSADVGLDDSQRTVLAADLDEVAETLDGWETCGLPPAVLAALTAVQDALVDLREAAGVPQRWEDEPEAGQ